MVYAARLKCTNGHTICGVIQRIEDRDGRPWIAYQAGLFFAQLMELGEIKSSCLCSCGAGAFTIDIVEELDQHQAIQ